MNRNKYLENLEIKNRRLLLKIYKKHINKLKIQIYEATEKGNDTVYLENLHNQVEKEIAQFEKELKQYSAGAVKTSYESGVKVAVVGEVAKEIAGTYTFGAANNQAMNVLAKTTYQPLSKMAQQVGRATLEYMKRENFQDTQTVLKALGKFVDSEFLRKTGIEGIGDVVVGSESWQKAARKIRDKIIKDANIKVPYYNKKGDVIRYVNAQDYARMVSRTTTANVFREGAKDRILETFADEGDLVEIIGQSSFPNSPCIPYQGKILSLEGRTKGYTTIAEAKANGLFHPNCIHNFAVTDKVMDIYDKREEKPKEMTKSEQPIKSFANVEKEIDPYLQDLINNKDAEVKAMFANAHKLKSLDLSIGSGGEYNLYTNSISICNIADKSYMKHTLAHELGHYFDFQTLALKDGLDVAIYPNSYFVLKEKIDRIAIKKVSDTPKKVLDTFAEIMEKPYSEWTGWAGVSDIYCSLSKGKLMSNHKVPYGHKPSYYQKSTDNQYTEIFANYFSMRAENQIKQLQFLKDNSPELSTILEDAFTMYVKELENGKPKK